MIFKLTEMPEKGRKALHSLLTAVLFMVFLMPETMKLASGPTSDTERLIFYCKSPR